LRDYLALASLPIRPAEIFTAKLCALGIAFGAFVLLLTGPSSVVFGATPAA
jgi:hypothetical protein